MKCPCCDHSIPDEMIVRMAASINGKKAVTGGARAGAGRPPRIPKVIAKAMEDFDMNEAELRKYILGQMKAFRQIPYTSESEAFWVAFKLSMASAVQGQAAIDWAKEAK